MNAIFLLHPKSTTAYIYDNNTIRQGLEKMRAHGYTAVPVITKEGDFAGCVSEGDFLWHILDSKDNSLKEKETICIKDIINPDRITAVRVDVNMEELLDRAMNQNFVPVTDDRNKFIGIITRRDIIKYFTEKQEAGGD